VKMHGAEGPQSDTPRRRSGRVVALVARLRPARTAPCLSPERPTWEGVMRHHTLALLLAALVLVLGTSANAITFADGQPHVIDAANSYPNDSIYVLAGPGSAATTVTVVDRGQAGTEPRGPYGNPTRVGIDATDNSLVNIFGGKVRSDSLWHRVWHHHGGADGGRSKASRRCRSNDFGW
jgi:hypothetical protein